MSEIIDWFGFPSTDRSDEARKYRDSEICPFISSPCTKTFRDGGASGVCAIKQKRGIPVVCCPNRLYGDDWEVLKYVSSKAFDDDYDLVPGPLSLSRAREIDDTVVAVFGQHWGGELPLPKKGNSGSYFVDYVLARVTPEGDMIDFTAIEVQSIDTTGNYRNAVRRLRGAPEVDEPSGLGFNWENVSKRILPQLIYKGNVLQQEEKCKSGLFFVTPKPVYLQIMKRLIGEGSPLPPYPMGGSSITFASFDPNWSTVEPGSPATLELTHELTTTVTQVAHNFTGVGNLPQAGSYARAIHKALGSSV